MTATMIGLCDQNKKKLYDGVNEVVRGDPYRLNIS